MDLSTIVAKLRADDLNRVADATGIPYETLRRISKGNTPGPRVTTVERIAAYYAPRRREKTAA